MSRWCTFHRETHTSELCKIDELIELSIKALKKYLAETPPATTINLTTIGPDMTTIPVSDYQLNAGDTVVITITDTDDVTGDVVTPDAGSVTAVLSSSTDTIVDNGDGTFTITAGSVDSVGNTVTVNATVGGVASGPEGGAVGTYDVVAAVTPPPDATTLSVSFGTESAPVAAAGPVPGNSVGDLDPSGRIRE